jgi:hypothetical protein
MCREGCSVLPRTGEGTRLSSRCWMPLWIADYLAVAGHLRALESGAYLHLIMHYWQRGGLPDTTGNWPRSPR